MNAQLIESADEHHWVLLDHRVTQLVIDRSSIRIQTWSLDGSADIRLAAPFVVLTGVVRVQKGATTIVQLESGEHFGEMALIDKEPRSATVTAVEDTRLLVMKRPDFLYLIKHERDLAVKLLWQFRGVLSARLRHTSRELGEARGRLSTDVEEMLLLADEDLEESP